MKKLLLPLINKQGYALLLTLVAITIFSVLGITFMQHGLSTAKQTVKIEEKVHATDMAELGVEYYNHIIEEILEKEKENVKNQIIQRLAAEIEDPEEKMSINLNDFSPEKIEQVANDVIKNYPFGFPTIKKTMDSSVNEKYFEIEIPAMYDPNDKELKYSVKGKVGDSEVIISANLELNLTISQKNNGNDKFVESITPGMEFRDCSHQKLKLEDGCKFENGLHIHNSEKNKVEITEDAHIYVRGKLTLPNNLEDYKYVKFIVDGNFETDNNFNTSTKYTLYVNGTAILGNINKEVYEAKICALRVKELGNNSAKNWKAKIYVFENPENFSTVIHLDDPEEFKKECGWNPANNGDISYDFWDIPISKRKYDYE